MELKTILGRRLGPMRLMGLMGLMGIMSLVGLMGCSEDHDQEAEVASQTVELMPLSPMFIEEQEQGVTRADTPWEPPEGYYLYSKMKNLFLCQWDLTNKSIDCFFTQNGQETLEGLFYYYNNEWRLNVQIKTATPVYVYGYIPSEVVDRARITDKEDGNAKYSEGAKLTLEGIQSVTPSDVCVIVGAKEGRSVSDDTTIEEGEVVRGLQAGQFLVKAQPATIPAVENAKNYVFLLFDHLYSALRFKFSVDKNYNDLRTIKIRKLEMKPYSDENQTPIRSKYNATVTLTAGNATPEVVLTPNNNSSLTDYVTLFDENADDPTSETPGTRIGPVELSTAPSDFLGCFVPGQTLRFSLRTTYDVYDKRGNLVRELCVAENYIDLKTKFNLTSTERGHIYFLPVKVEPTYLYVLSEPDVDNPTITIN